MTSKPIPPPPSRKLAKRNGRKSPFPYLAPEHRHTMLTPTSERHAARYNDDPKKIERKVPRTMNVVQCATLDPAFAPAATDRQAENMRQRDIKRSQYVGRTSKLPECGPSPMRSDSNHGSKFRNV